MISLNFLEEYDEYFMVDGEPGDGTKQGDCEEGEFCMSEIIVVCDIYRNEENSYIIMQFDISKFAGNINL